MLVEVAIGEVVDKLTILKIKMERISDPSRLDHIEREFNILTDALKDEGVYVEQKFFDELKTINETIWDTEEKLRREDLTVQEYVLAARDNAKYNDDRFVVKNEVNKKYDSLVQEQKAHSRLYPTN